MLCLFLSFDFHQGDEEHVSGWDLIYDNGFIEIDPEQCGYTTFLGAAVPQAEEDEEDDTQRDQGQGNNKIDNGDTVRDHSIDY